MLFIERKSKVHDLLEEREVERKCVKRHDQKSVDRNGREMNCSTSVNRKVEDYMI